MKSLFLRTFPLVVVAFLAAILVALAPVGLRLSPPHAFELPSWHGPLGFGEAGIDLSYAVGLAVLRSILLAAIVGVLALSVGVALGALAGLRGAGTPEIRL